jgi:hypothetical protein
MSKYLLLHQQALFGLGGVNRLRQLMRCVPTRALGVVQTLGVQMLW